MIIPKICYGSSSRNFDGVNDSVAYGVTNMDVTTGDVTFGGWFRATGDSGTDFAVGKKDTAGTAEAGYAILKNPNNDYWYCEVADGTNQTSGNGHAGTEVAEDVWAQFTATWNATTDVCTLYLNGVSAGTNSGTNIDSLTNAANDNFMTGTADDVGNDYDGQVMNIFGIKGSVLSTVLILEIMWKPCSIELNNCSLILGGSPERDVGTFGESGTVGGTTVSAFGPPVGFGGFLPL